MINSADLQAWAKDNVSSDTIITSIAKKFFGGSGVALLDATYKTDGEGNLDYSYVNTQLGFGFVIDGAGHGKPDRKEIQDPVIKSFIQTYENELKNSHFKTIEEAQEFVQKQMDAFGTKFNAVLPDYAPAIMFTQIIKIGDERCVLMAHMSDTALYIKTKDGWQTTPSQKDIGFGSNGLRPGEINLPKVQIIKGLLPGDELVGFTDGIGEFLTKSECEAILNANKDRRSLLEEFKQKIIAKGNEREVKMKQRGGSQKSGTEGDQAASGGKAIKFHNPDPLNPQDHDDISLFCLRIR